MLRKKVNGFTLIELMVVIVIIGVLASLAIPRFSEASNKAKVAEAPRVIASYESAQLAYIAENSTTGSMSDLIFDLSAVDDDSKWFNYTESGNDGIQALALSAMGLFKVNQGLSATVSVDGAVTRGTVGVSLADAKKYVPNFFKSTGP